MEWIKIDGVKSRTRKGEANLRRFFRSAMERSGAKLTFDLDVTAEVRPGYFGMPEFGTLFVENRFFGGNVDVTGLLCSCDIAEAIRAAVAEHPGWTYVVPKVIFNDDGVTLDDATLEDMGKAAGVPVSVVSCNATGFLPELVELARA